MAGLFFGPNGVSGAFLVKSQVLLNEILLVYFFKVQK
jgi:hypothetical protein